MHKTKSVRGSLIFMEDGVSIMGIRVVLLALKGR
jgi:hypothetical protein